MRPLPSTALALGVFLIAPTARAQDDARAVIEKAVQAHGGGAVLDKYLAGRVQTKGVIVLSGTEFPFTNQLVYQLPDRVRTTVEVTAQGVHRSVTQVLTGGKVLMFVGGLAQQVPNTQVEEMKTALYVQNLARLTPLLKEDRYKLKALGEKAVEGKPAAGVRVSSEGQRDVSLYFDKDSGLLVMVERPGFDALGKPTQQQEYYSNYREASGLKYPTKTLVRQNGKKYIESDVTEYKPLERVDSREFTNVP
jgi:hypothetical protein